MVNWKDAGQPAIVDVVPADGIEVADLLADAAAVQAMSEHPLARAVVREARDRGARPRAASRLRYTTGRGVEAEVAGEIVLAGNAAYMAERGVDLGALRDRLSAMEKKAKTVIAVARGGRLLGLIALADRVRPEAAVATLRARGIASRMLTGEHAGVARAVAEATGLDGWDGPVRPAEKASAVAALRRAGAVVAMVGDGVNDAPALAVADVGIAMGTGTDVAMETAGITLMRPDPRLVPAAIDIAAAKIRQNLFWAFIYNVVGIPLAAAGYLTPALAGAAMALSSVSVVTNAGLLARWRPRL
ncbi:MAG TPA: HAD-IC family P-type ATPase [Methylomirabilota bacterium]|nr:HAD-IC family P-type ATPase [Methylomirabilota bacterium]